MKFILSISMIAFFTSSLLSQGFEVKAEGEQTFSFTDKRNQVLFYSQTPIEDINGMTTALEGTATFNPSDLNSLKGEIVIPVSSLKSGIDMRDEHMRSEGWLDASKYPNVKFEIKDVKNVNVVTSNKIEAVVVGDFTLRGVTKQEEAAVVLTYLDESPETQRRAKGDLLSVNGSMDISLSDYNVENKLIGQKVADKISLKINIVGSNQF